MRQAVGRTFAAVGAIGAVVATSALPWAVYGAFEIWLDSFPGWGFYLAPSAVLNLLTGWVVLTRRSDGRLPLLLAGCLSGAATIAGAVAVALRYDDSGAFFGPIVPAVLPSVGIGAPVAIVSALASCAALTVTLAGSSRA